MKSQSHSQRPQTTVVTQRQDPCLGRQCWRRNHRHSGGRFSGQTKSRPPSPRKCTRQCWRHRRSSSTKRWTSQLCNREPVHQTFSGQTETGADQYVPVVVHDRCLWFRRAQILGDPTGPVHRNNAHVPVLVQTPEIRGGPTGPVLRQDS